VLTYTDISLSLNHNFTSNLTAPHEKDRFISFLNLEIINSLLYLEKFIVGSVFVILGLLLAIYGEKFLKLVFSLLSVIALSLWVISLFRIIFNIDLN